MKRQTLAGAILCLGVLLCLRLWVAEPIVVSSSSMSPTVTPGSLVWLDRISPRLAGVHTGQLVTFRNPDGSGTVLKRVVAEAGHNVSMKDGVLYVDDIPADEPFVDQSTIDGVYFGTVRIRDGEVFVLGDNREVSIDSRHYGPIRIDTIEATVIGYG